MSVAMILYSGDLSPYSAKVRMQIYAMGVSDDFSFELPVVQFFSGKLKEVSLTSVLQACIAHDKTGCYSWYYVSDHGNFI